MGCWRNWQKRACQSVVLAASSCTCLHREVSTTSQVLFCLALCVLLSISYIRDLAKQMMSSWGWEELFDDHGVKYYGNPQLKITQYQHPSLGIVRNQEPSSLNSIDNSDLSRTELRKPSTLALPHGWEMLKDASGYTYLALFQFAVIFFL
jgi:hypothetical protein